MINSSPYDPPAKDTVCSWAGYLWFVWEREAIRIARDNGVLKDNWTADPVLKQYRFTNIRRRDDRMTKWFIEHLVEPASDSGDENIWFTLLIGRLINWPPTLQALINHGVIPCGPEYFDAKTFVAVLEEQKRLGQQVYGGAYMVYPTMKDPGGVKSASIAKWIIGDAVTRASDIYDAVWHEEPSIERITSALSKCYGVSTFIGGQVAADLSYTGHFGEAADLYTWAPLGPGSQKGLNYLLGRDLQKQWEQGAFNRALMETNGRICEELYIIDLTLHDVQNTMCEYSKYARTVLGEGKPKTTYRPQTAY